MTSPGFTGGLIDRAAELRPNAAATAALLRDPAARLLPVFDGAPLAEGGRLAWRAAAHELLALSHDPPLLLGREAGGAGRFAIDVGRADPAARSALAAGGASFESLRGLAARLPAGEAAIAATARSVLGWHAHHGFCARCGAATRAAQGGWRRDCPSCKAQHFPRTDPVSIMLVERNGKCLLARRPTFESGRASVIAGFIEPGESIEEAVRRETFEEAGLRVGRVQYVASQPWPFPSQLMVACVAEALGDDPIRLDHEELEDGFWATREDVARALEGRGYMTLAPPEAIAHTLLKLWAEGKIGFS